MIYQKQWVERADNVPGYIYLMEAVGFHGILPGCYLRRCKIGLSRNPQLRLENFHANQPPCDLRILKTIWTPNMEETEKKLHEKFRNCNVKLIKSKEWFDFNLIQFARVMWAMSWHDQAIDVHSSVNLRPSLAKLLMISGAGILLLNLLAGQFHTPESQASHSVSRVMTSPVAHSKIRRH